MMRQFPSVFAVSIPTTAASSSTGSSPVAEQAADRTRPKAVPATATITDWSKPRTAPSSANTWATATSRRHAEHMQQFTLPTSILISTTIAPAPTRLTLDEKAARATSTTATRPVETLLACPTRRSTCAPTHGRRLTTHSPEPQRNRKRAALQHAKRQLFASCGPRRQGVEMTEEKNPRKTKTGFFLFLGNAYTKAAFTHSTPRLRLHIGQNQPRKELSPPPPRPFPQAHPSIGKDYVPLPSEFSCNYKQIRCAHL